MCHDCLVTDYPQFSVNSCDVTHSLTLCFDHDFSLFRPLVTHLPHVRKVIDEAPPEYIIMIVVAFLEVFAMTISLVHIVNKHRAFMR